MNLSATDRPTGRRSLKRRLKRLLTVWKHGRLEIKFNLLFYAIGDRERKKRGIGVRTVLAAAVVILTALGCMAAWMPLGSPAGVYDAPKLAVLEDGAKALLVISDDHTWAVYLHSDGTNENSRPEIAGGTWQKDPGDGLFHLVYKYEPPQQGIEEFSAKCYLWGMEWHTTDWHGTPITFRFRRNLFGFL